MVRTISRVNGWSLPPHPLQILAWFVVLFLTLMTFGLVVPAIVSLPARIVLNVILGLVILVSVIINLVVTTVDPADTSVQDKVRGVPRPQFDRQQHKHVIDENYFCNICETSIHPSSKHCRKCNKCVLDFDHHCKWLNNCVGAKNYRIFLIYVFATTICTILILITSVTVLALNFAQPETIRRINGSYTESMEMFGAEVPKWTWLLLISLTIIVSCIIFALTLHLMIFHLRLIAKGLTTYNFIMQQKRETEQQQQLQHQRETEVNEINNAPGEQTTVNNVAVSERKSPSLLDKLTTCLKREKQTRDILENRVATNEQQTNDKFMQVSLKQKNPTQNDIIAMDDLSSYSQSQEIEKFNNRNLLQQQSTPADSGAVVYDSHTSTRHRSTLPPLTRGTSTRSSVPYEQVDHENPRTSVSSNTPLILDVNPNKSTVPPLPPISEKHTNLVSTRIYEPMVESVFLTNSSKELTLPCITLHPPDADHLTEEFLNEIPLSALNMTSQNSFPDYNSDSANIITARVDKISSNGPGLFYATGQFTVAYRHPNIVRSPYVNASKPNIWYSSSNPNINTKDETVSQYSNSNSTVSNTSNKRVRFDSQTTY